MHFRFLFFFIYPATTEIYTYLHTLSLHDSLPICRRRQGPVLGNHCHDALGDYRPAAGATPLVRRADIAGTRPDGAHAARDRIRSTDPDSRNGERPWLILPAVPIFWA